VADLFWDELIEIEEIKVKIEKHGFSDEEKTKLLEIVYQTLDLRIFDVILTQLPSEKHKKFLDQFSKLPHNPSLLQSLKEDAQDIEDKIKDMGRKIKEEIIYQLDQL